MFNFHSVREQDIDFPDVDGIDEALLNQEVNLDPNDFPFSSSNLISAQIIDSSNIQLRGWWMPQVRWNPEIDCSLPDQPGTCGKVNISKSHQAWTSYRQDLHRA